jgi:transcription elongation GreA/GreB family factor
MAETVYVSPRGLELLNARLKQVSEELAAIRAEKSVAYTASGDTWHDNPTFNRLEQDENRKAREVAELSALVGSARVFSFETRNTARVQFGSIVHFRRYYKVSGEEEELVQEVAGYGETDTAKSHIAYNAPMMRALIGLRVGETKETSSPKGRVEYEVLGFYSTWEEVPEGFRPR